MNLFDPTPYEIEPKWVRLRDYHGIYTHEIPCPHKWEHPWSAYYFSERISEKEAILRIVSDFASMEENGTMATGETEEEAVITLIHRAKLEGWEKVSIRKG